MKENVEFQVNTKMSEKNTTNSQEFWKYVKILNQDTIAITDYNSVEIFPKIERFFRKNHFPMKVIYGATVSMLVHQIIVPVTILVRNQTGLKNLYKIISSIKTKNLVRYGKQVITKKEMVRFSEGLLYGFYILDRIDIYEQMSDTDIVKDMIWYDFIGVDTTKWKEMESKKDYLKQMITLAKKNRKIVVATRNVDDVQKNNQDRYLIDEMLQYFSFLEDDFAKEIVIDNTRKLSSLIDAVEIIKNKVYFPKIENSKEIFIQQIYENAHRFYGKTIPSIVENRIQEELYGKEKKKHFGIINTQNESIYLIYKDLVEKSHEFGYPVLPRGYVSASFLAYLIGITEINPLPSHYHCLKCGYSEFHDKNGKPYSATYACGIDIPNKKCPNCHTLMKQDGFHLPYEMFLGCHVEQNPNINLNFSLHIQGTLQHYLEERFGEKNILYAGVTGFSKRKDSSISKITGQHPGSLFIVPKGLDIDDFTPVAYPCDEPKYHHKITHLDYHDIKYHLMIFHILGHTVPDEIKKLEDRTKRKASSIPLHDRKTFHFLWSGQTDDIFEFSNPLAKKLLTKIKPSTFHELINILGLVHNEEKNKNINISSSEILFREDMYHYFIQKKLPENLAYSITKFISNGGVKEDFDTWKQYQKTMQAYNIDENFMKRCQNISYFVSKAHCVSYAIAAFQIAWYQVHFSKIFKEVMAEIK